MRMSNKIQEYVNALPTKLRKSEDSVSLFCFTGNYHHFLGLFGGREVVNGSAHNKTEVYNVFEFEQRHCRFRLGHTNCILSLF